MQQRICRSALRDRRFSCSCASRSAFKLRGPFATNTLMPIETLPPPAKSLLLLESRIGFELAGFVLSMPRLRRELPRGNGQPLIIVPGFGTTDVATAPLRRLLNGLGYASYGWGLGRNLGMRSGVRDALNAQLRAEIGRAHV